MHLESIWVRLYISVCMFDLFQSNLFRFMASFSWQVRSERLIHDDQLSTAEFYD